MVNLIGLLPEAGQCGQWLLQHYLKDSSKKLPPELLIELADEFKTAKHAVAKTLETNKDRRRFWDICFVAGLRAPSYITKKKRKVLSLAVTQTVETEIEPIPESILLPVHIEKAKRGPYKKKILENTEATEIKQTRGRRKKIIEGVVVKKGRGRPRKIVEEIVPKRGRGRPKKIIEAAVVKRGRGRPKKSTKAKRGRPRNSQRVVVKRGRGRPRNSQKVVIKRGRGRPKKIIKRGRGRPRKDG